MSDRFTVLWLVINSNRSKNWHVCSASVPEQGVPREQAQLFLKLVQQLSGVVCEACFILVIAASAALLIRCLKDTSDHSLCCGLFCSLPPPNPCAFIHKSFQSIWNQMSSASCLKNLPRVCRCAAAFGINGRRVFEDSPKQFS